MKYKELHIQLVDWLRTQGIYYQYDDRIPAFWLRTNLPKLPYEAKFLDQALWYLDQLVALRTKGEEPAHENGKYT